MALETPQTVRKELENAVTQINTILNNYSNQIAELSARLDTIEAPKSRGKANGA